MWYVCMWRGQVSMFGARQPPHRVCRVVWCVWCGGEQEELLKKRAEALVRRGRQVVEDMRQRQNELHARMDVLLGARFRAEMDAVQVLAALPHLPFLRTCASTSESAARAVPLGPCTRAYVPSAQARVRTRKT